MTVNERAETCFTREQPTWRLAVAATWAPSLCARRRRHDMAELRRWWTARLQAALTDRTADGELLDGNRL